LSIRKLNAEKYMCKYLGGEKWIIVGESGKILYENGCPPHATSFS
jgi:hypothetical protein